MGHLFAFWIKGGIGIEGWKAKLDQLHPRNDKALFITHLDFASLRMYII